MTVSDSGAQEVYPRTEVARRAAETLTRHLTDLILALGETQPIGDQPAPATPGDTPPAPDPQPAEYPTVPPLGSYSAKCGVAREFSGPGANAVHVWVQVDTKSKCNVKIETSLGNTAAGTIVVKPGKSGNIGTEADKVTLTCDGGPVQGDCIYKSAVLWS